MATKRKKRVGRKKLKIRPAKFQVTFYLYPDRDRDLLDYMMNTNGESLAAHIAVGLRNGISKTGDSPTVDSVSVLDAWDMDL